MEKSSLETNEQKTSSPPRTVEKPTFSPPDNASSTTENQAAPIVPTGSFPSILMVHNDTDPEVAEIFKKLSILDRILTPVILIAMIVGVIIGEFVPNVQRAFDTARFDSVSAREQSSFFTSQTMLNPSCQQSP